MVVTYSSKKYMVETFCFSLSRLSKFDGNMKCPGHFFFSNKNIISLWSKIWRNALESMEKTHDYILKWKYCLHFTVVLKIDLSCWIIRSRYIDIIYSLTIYYYYIYVFRAYVGTKYLYRIFRTLYSFHAKLGKKFLE